MSAPRAKSRRDAERGTVLLSTLLVLSLMSAVALGLLATLRVSVDTARTLQEGAQADLYAQGAESFAQAQADQLAALDGPGLNAALAQAQPVLLPFDGGSIRARLRDGTHCLRLSGLAGANGKADAAEQARLQRLLEVLDVPRPDAARISAAAADWVDADTATLPNGAEDGTYLFRDPPHRTANTHFADISELRALEGMSEAVFRALRPHVCLGTPGGPTRFNVDSADARHLPVLAAILGGDAPGLAQAAALLDARPASGFGSTTALLSAPGLEGDARPAGFDPDVFVFAPDRVEVEAVIRYGEAERSRLLAFELGPNRAVRVHRDWGPDAFRPDLTPGEPSQTP